MFNKVMTLPGRGNKTARSGSLRRKEPRRVPRPPRPTDTLTRSLAWGVHLYTALGLVLAAAIAVLLVRLGPESFRWSFVLMAIATFIDATDGTLARRIRIKEVLPNFDGRKLDDITDFLTYTSLPLLLIWRAQLMPPGAEWCLVLPLLASAYGFCQGEAKTEDGYFLGFPSLWNVVAFYLYVLQIPPWATLAVVLTLALLTFVPSRYLYPSQPGKLNRMSNVLAAGWAVILAWVLWTLPSHEVLQAHGGGGVFRAAAFASLFYPVFYVVASWVISVRFWLRPRAA
ncbi:MAG: phosphatidylcholine synthase [Isosphaeraceae bacterium]